MSGRFSEPLANREAGTGLLLCPQQSFALFHFTPDILGARMPAARTTTGTTIPSTLMRGGTSKGSYCPYWFKPDQVCRLNFDKGR